MSLVIRTWLAAGWIACLSPAFAESGGEDFAANPGVNVFASVNYGARWPNGVIAWRYNPSGQPASYSTAEALAAIQVAMANWTQGCGVRFEYQGSSSATVINQDGVSVIGWGNTRGYSGYTTLWWDGNLQITEGDIALDATKLGDLADFQAIVTHELGHLLGLTHSDQPRSIMFSNPYHSNPYKLLPKGDDLTACAQLYGATGLTAHADLGALTAQNPGGYRLNFVIGPDQPTSTPPTSSLVILPATTSGTVYFAVYYGNVPAGRSMRLRLVSPDGYEYYGYAFNSRGGSSAYTYVSWNWSGSLGMQRLPGTWHVQLLDEGQVVGSQPFVVQSDYAVPSIPLLALHATTSGSNAAFSVQSLSGSGFGGALWMLDQQSLSGSTTGASATLAAGVHTVWLHANSGSSRYAGTIANSSSQGDGPDNTLRIDRLSTSLPASAAFAATASGTPSAFSLDGNIQMAHSGRQQIYVAAQVGSALLFKTGSGWTTATQPLLEASGPGWLTVNILKREDIRGLPAGIPVFIGYGSSLGDVVSNSRFAPVFTLP